MDMPKVQQDLNDHTYQKIQQCRIGKVARKRRRRRTVPQERNILSQELVSQLHKKEATLTKKESSKLKTIANYTRNTELIAATLLSIPSLRSELLNQLFRTIGERPKLMTNRIHGEISVLMKKNREHLKNFKIVNIINEMLARFPELVILLLRLMIPDKSMTDHSKIEVVLPKLAMIYSIVMQTRHRDLSAMQRVVSLCLMDNVVDQKVKPILILTTISANTIL